MYSNYLIKSLLLFLIFSGAFISQSKKSSVEGKITDIKNLPLVGISVFLDGTTIGAATDVGGHFQITNVQPGNYDLIVSGVGYTKLIIPVKLESDKKQILSITLESEVLNLDEVVVETKSEAEELREKGFSIEVIESKEQQNFTTDINQVLKKTPGVHLRETGGLGSGFKLSLNGLSGNQIRYFIDEIPMENFGSALSLNNYPVNLIDKLEIYKGVVPISLGSDALGGAVNIVSGYWQRTFLDASYSYGSFNTQRVSLNGQYADSKIGFFLKGSFFYNHSKNNYEMRDVPVYDLELGNLIRTINIERFHDDYTSQMISGEAGLFNKSFADKFSIKFIAASSRKNYQHPDNNILRVFGDFHSTNNSLLFTATYKKQLGNFNLKAYAVAGKIEESVIDTSSRKFNWAGDFIDRSANDPKGELLERRSHMILTDKVLRSNVGLDYSISNNHGMSLSFSQNYLERTGEDKVDVFNQSYKSPNFIHKNMLGLAYNYKSDNGLLEGTIFGKEYFYYGKIITFDYDDTELVSEPSLRNTGYGLALSYRLSENLLVKSSFEKAYRIPESYEILGDGIYVNPNPSLQPEKSYNFNFGARYIKRFSMIELRSEVNYFYRSSEDFIRFNPLGPFGEYENLNNVRSTGIEGSIDLNYRELISLNTNVTYQNITDQTEFDEGLPNTNYQSRVPNVPYFFGNARIGYSPTDRTSENKLSFYLNFRYVHEFFLNWEKLGNKETKFLIPSQFTQDFQVEYSLNDGMYNISFSITNITDRIVYDNYNIQKPGRSIDVKLRYFLR